jgi:hypothetical protein
MLKRVLAILLAVGVLAPFLAEAGATKAGGVLKYVLLRDPTGWDPHINQGATQYTFTA